MTVPIWAASIIGVAIVSMVTYFIKLVLDHERRITRLEDRADRDKQ